MPPAEPQLALRHQPLKRYFFATRPAFLSVTLVGCLLGLATAHVGGVTLEPVKAVLTVLFALVAHAGVNVLNDYYDAANGTDDANTERLFPFTGGSRFIQNQVLSAREVGVFGYALLAAVVPAGLWLAWHSAPGLIWIGLAGLLVGWAYSAPPLALMSRGLGELAVAAGWLIVVVGSDFVQRGDTAVTPLAAGLGFALLVANLLFINQFPDFRADAQAGKRNLVVRLGPMAARWIYPLVALAAHLWLIVLIGRHALPPVAAVACLSLIPALKAARLLLTHAQEPAELLPAIKLTIAAAHVHGLLLVAALVRAPISSHGIWTW